MWEHGIEPYYFLIVGSTPAPNPNQENIANGCGSYGLKVSYVLLILYVIIHQISCISNITIVGNGVKQVAYYHRFYLLFT